MIIISLISSIGKVSSAGLDILEFLPGIRHTYAIMRYSIKYVYPGSPLQLLFANIISGSIPLSAILVLISSLISLFATPLLMMPLAGNA